VKRLGKFRLAILALVLTTIQMVILVPLMSRLKTDKPMGPVYAAADIEAGRTVYQEQCAACHASDGAGNPDMKAAMPRLDIRAAVAGNPDGLRQVIRSGKGAMPAFTTLTEDELRQVLRFLRTLGEKK
jgi:mono/diheme cytochrome c family protein